MKFVFSFAILIVLVFLYVFVNFKVAIFVINLPWIEIKGKYETIKVNIADFLGSRAILSLSAVITIGWLVGLFILKSADSIELYSATLLFLGFFPIAASIIQLDKVFFEFEPKSKFVSWGFTIAFATAIWFCKAAISDLLNQMFPFDPGTMPVAWSGGVFLAVIAIFSLIFLIFTFPLQILILLGIFGNTQSKHGFFKRLVRCILPIGIYYGVLVAAFSFHRLTSPGFASLLISRIAFEFDFNDKHRCYKVKNGQKILLEKSEKVLFLGSTQKLGISAKARKLPSTLFHQIQDNEFKTYVPTEFHTVVCNDPYEEDLFKTGENSGGEQFKKQ